MNTVYASRCGLLLGALSLLTTRTLAAPSGEEIIKRASAAMQSARSYQAVWQMSMNMGQMGSVSLAMDIKMIPGKKMYMKMTPVGQPTGQMAMGAAMMNMQMVDDGTNMWAYMPAMKQYNKGPSQVKASQMNLTRMAGVAPGATYKLVGTENVGGRPAHKIQVTLKNVQIAGGGKQSMHIFIDQATNRFRQMTMSMALPAGPNQPAQQMNMNMLVTNEKVNAPIPASYFKFTPPPGAREVQGGPGMGMPMGGGMMGGGGGGR